MDNKFNVPEPPTGIGSVFLTEYWNQEKPLPKLRGPEVGFYFLQRGFQTVTALPMSSVITIMTIAVSLLLLAGSMLALQNVGRLIVSAGSTFYVTAYVRDNVSEKDLADFTREWEGNPRVRSVSYTSKEQALTNFRRDLGDRSAFLDGLGNENPLPASVDIILRPDDLGIDGVNTLLDQLRRETKVVQEVVYGNEWVEKMQGILHVFRLLAGVTLIVILVIVISLIANTIKLVFYARRDEIAIMQLVGASQWFVKTPFIIGGLLQGFVGSVLGLLLLRIGFSLMTAQFGQLSVFGMIVPEFAFLSGAAMTAIVFAGLLIGALGSFFSLGRFMNV